MGKLHRSAACEAEYSTTKSFAELGREYILECMDIDLVAGTATWKERPPHHFVNMRGCKQFNSQWAGKQAGCGSGAWGYWLIRLTCGSKQYVMRRSGLIWLMSGRTIEPGMVIDHINRVRDDDRIENLRQCPQAENVRNRSVRKNNRSGHSGIYETRQGKWQVTITLGSFDELQKAIEVRREAEIRYFKEYSPLSQLPPGQDYCI